MTHPTAASSSVPSVDFARTLYARLARNQQALRRRLKRPLTLTDKLLLGHLQDPEGQALGEDSQLLLRADRVVLQDVLGQTAFLQLALAGVSRVAVPTTVHCDHLIQARRSAGPDLADSLAEDDEVYRFLRSAAARYGAGFWKPGAGIIHQVVLENHAFPGQLILGTDSHTPNAGGLGAFAMGVGGADAVQAMAGLSVELLNPKRIAVVLTGALTGWAAPKDLILEVAGRLGTAGGTNAVLEYIGSGARSLSATGKATICNMGAEVGATTSLFPADAHMHRYLSATERSHLVPLVKAHQALLEPDSQVEAHPERHYDQVLRVDLSALEPRVVGPHSPDRVRTLSELATDARAGRFPELLSAALIGSCTNSSYEDMGRAADVAAQAAAHGLRAQAALMVTPGSEQIRATIARDGQLQQLTQAGATVLANACGPCIGQWRRADPEQGPSSILTSYNRNFRGRNDGRRSTCSFIGSPEVVMALALAGRLSFNPLTDSLLDDQGQPFRLRAPAPAPDLPPEGFISMADRYIAPDPSAWNTPPDIAPDSHRIQALTPWPAWSGQDFTELPILFQARGKTTTDQISPAGKWLRYRGHLERFSDNLLSGGVSAHDSGVGRSRDVVTRQEGSVAEVARGYRARGQAWVIIGDHNYGEGSSREHAALSPRLLGGAAVIARSFARIHESNLKKQGLLALTFADPDDYERLGPDDRLSLVRLQTLAPGGPVRCVVHKPDGARLTLLLTHSYSRPQLDWFRQGSYLAGVRERA